MLAAMPTIHDALAWFTSGFGRAIAAGVIVAIMYVVKLHPWVERRLLTTPRRRQIAIAFLAVGPAMWLLADGSVPPITVIETALEAFLGAMGIHVGLKVLRGQTVGDSPPPRSQASVFAPPEGANGAAHVDPPS